MWRAQVDFATNFVEEASSLEIIADDPHNHHGSGGGDCRCGSSTGQADLLRERIDRRLGQ